MTFMFTGGRVSLDLLATSRYRNRLEPTEHLDSPDALKSWMVDSRLVTDVPRVTAADLDRVQCLREAIYRVVTISMTAARPEEEDMILLNEAAGRAPVTLELHADGTVRRRGSVAQILSSLARDAVDLLGSEDRAQLRECEASDCTRIYVDNTRGSRRRWCSTTSCGNRAKVAAYRSRAVQRTT